MSIKGTSVEVIVVLVVFPFPLYGAGQKNLSSPLYMRDRKTSLLPLRVVIEISIGMTGVLIVCFSSPPLYLTDRPKRSQEDGFEESVIDESEALIQIRSSVNFLLQDECFYLYQESQSTHQTFTSSSSGKSMLI